MYRYQNTAEQSYVRHNTAELSGNYSNANLYHGDNFRQTALST